MAVWQYGSGRCCWSWWYSLGREAGCLTPSHRYPCGVSWFLVCFWGCLMFDACVLLAFRHSSPLPFQLGWLGARPWTGKLQQGPRRAVCIGIGIGIGIRIGVGIHGALRCQCQRRRQHRQANRHSAVSALRRRRWRWRRREGWWRGCGCGGSGAFCGGAGAARQGREPSFQCTIRYPS